MTHKSGEIIRTKLHRPFTRRELVTRSRLQEQVLKGLGGPLTLITAPAGFGKTTLAADGILASGMRSAWLQLDKNDNQVESFLRYLIAAFQEAGLAIGNEARELLGDGQIVSPAAVLTSLVNDLDLLGEDLVLVIDDYQFISSPAVHEAAAFLIEHSPAKFHLLFASRSDPPLPVTRLRGRGHTVELRASDLRFTSAEAAQFLNDVMGLGLDLGSVSMLAERTEGWIAGLQMAAISLRDRKYSDDFIRGFSGTNRYIMDYLVEEVLAGQPPEIQNFLLCTSILERLSAPLCEAVLQAQNPADPTVAAPSSGFQQTEIGDCQQILERLDKANLFLVPLDEERRWYRYHHLFADLLRLRLEQAHPGLRRQLHLRAAAWYELNGLIIEAIQHASSAPDDELVERLIDSHYFEMMNRGEMFWVRFWMGNLSKDLVVRRPWLCLYEALNLSWFGKLAEAEAILAQAEKLVHLETNLKGETADTLAMAGYYDYVKSRITAMQDDLQAAIELCKSAREKVGPDNLTLQIDFLITLGFEYFLLGDFENAQLILNEMIDIGAQVQAVNNPVAGYCLLARIAVYRGRLREADEILQKALKLIQDPGAKYLGVFGLVEVEKARLLYRRNELASAREHALSGLEKLPFWGKVDDTCLTYALLWQIERAMGNRSEAEEFLGKAERLIETQGVFSEARGVVASARLLQRLGEAELPVLGSGSLAATDRSRLYDPFHFQNERADLVQAYLFFVHGRLDESFHLLGRLDAAARRAGRDGRLIDILILTTLVHQARGEPQLAVANILQALELASSEGNKRAFIDASRFGHAHHFQGQPVVSGLGPTLEHALRHALRHTIKYTNGRTPTQSEDSRLRSFITELLSAIESHPQGAGLQAKPASPTPGEAAQLEYFALIEQLTQRELQVLRLIAQGKTNQEIARELVVAPGTVKAHTASIFRKLGVSNRTEAARRASLLGLGD